MPSRAPGALGARRTQLLGSPITRHSDNLSLPLIATYTIEYFNCLDGNHRSFLEQSFIFASIIKGLKSGYKEYEMIKVL